MKIEQDLALASASHTCRQLISGLVSRTSGKQKWSSPIQTVTTILLWYAAIAAGIMAGVYFTFSTFAMQSFAALEGDAGMVAMQKLNRVIVRSPFLPLFFSSSAVCGFLMVAGVMDFQAPGGWQILAGAVIYVAGMLLVTMWGNVPLNNALDAAIPGTAEGAAIWADYLQRWMKWNHIRTVSCTASMALLVWAIAIRWNA